VYPLSTVAGFGAVLAANHALVPHVELNGVRVLSSEARDDDREALLTTVQWFPRILSLTRVVSRTPFRPCTQGCTRSLALDMALAGGAACLWVCRVRRVQRLRERDCPNDRSATEVHGWNIPLQVWRLRKRSAVRGKAGQDLSEGVGRWVRQSHEHEPDGSFNALVCHFASARTHWSSSLACLVPTHTRYLDALCLPRVFTRTTPPTRYDRSGWSIWRLVSEGCGTAR
jgi:hypothetical protein